jgi:hypothetical protein
MMKAWIVGVSLLTGPVHSALATSVTAQIEVNRIYVAADSRTSNPEHGIHSDGMCKIILFKRAAFTVTGQSDMIYADSGEVAWDGFKLAQKVYADNKGNLIDASIAWVTQSVDFFTPFFSHQVQEGERILVGGGSQIASSFFFGFFPSTGRPRIFTASVYVDREGSLPRKPRPVSQILLPREEPYSSNGITQELLDGFTERAKAAQARWVEKAKSIKPSDRDIRRLEFFIKETEKYDIHVGGPINILEITADKDPQWPQNHTCQ